MVLDHPHQLHAGWVCAERKAAEVGEFIGARATLELADQILGTSIWPHHSLAEGLAGVLVPANGRFTLVGDANGFDLGLEVA